jgi:hypothetical protein
MDVWLLAQTITPTLAASLVALEHDIGGAFVRTVPDEALAAAIAQGWSYTTLAARQSSVNLDLRFVASLHEQVGRPIAAPGIGEFRDGNPPRDWTGFGTDMAPSALEHGLSGSAAAIFAQLYWGGHVTSLAPTIAWLLIDGLRLQEGLHPIVPDPRHGTKFKEYLNWAGPETHDAESLRALFGRLEDEQVPQL